MSAELDNASKEIDKMGRKLQEVHNNNHSDYSMLDQVKQKGIGANINWYCWTKNIGKFSLLLL